MIFLFGAERTLCEFVEWLGRPSVSRHGAELYKDAGVRDQVAAFVFLGHDPAKWREIRWLVPEYIFRGFKRRHGLHGMPRVSQLDALCVGHIPALFHRGIWFDYVAKFIEVGLDRESICDPLVCFH